MNRRRQLVAIGAGFALSGTLAQGLRRAVAATPLPVAADDRPAMRGRAPSIFVGHGSPMNWRRGLASKLCPPLLKPPPLRIS